MSRRTLLHLVVALLICLTAAAPASARPVIPIMTLTARLSDAGRHGATCYTLSIKEWVSPDEESEVQMIRRDDGGVTTITTRFDVIRTTGRYSRVHHGPCAPGRGRTIKVWRDAAEMGVTIITESDGQVSCQPGFEPFDDPNTGAPSCMVIDRGDLSCTPLPDSIDCGPITHGDPPCAFDGSNCAPSSCPTGFPPIQIEPNGPLVCFQPEADGVTCPAGYALRSDKPTAATRRQGGAGGVPPECVPISGGAGPGAG
jgi:hypothetical protein